MTFEPKDLLLCVWVHGFKGTDVTFESFPDRVCHLLRETHPTLRVESRVFPAYQTRGELNAAVLAFVDWLTTLVVELEVNHGAGGGAGKAKVVLMGHSMGGLLIADAARDIARNTRKGDQMWPRVVALVAYDTPYLGLHPHVFKHGISTAAGYYDTARNVASNLAFLSPVALGLGIGKFGSSPSSSQAAAPSGNTAGPPSSSSSSPSKPPPPSNDTRDTPKKTSTSSWLNLSSALASQKTLYGLGAVAMGAAAVGTAYYTREHFVNGWKFGYEHMTFVGNLWDGEAMERRLDGIEELRRDYGVVFWNHYTHLPPTPTNLLARTFTILPKPSHPSLQHWRPQRNTLAPDEVSAHMGMFNPKGNDGFYELGLEVVRGVGERVEEEGVRRGGGMAGEGGGWQEEKEEGGMGFSMQEENGVVGGDNEKGKGEGAPVGPGVLDVADAQGWDDEKAASRTSAGAGAGIDFNQQSDAVSVTTSTSHPSSKEKGGWGSVPPMEDEGVWR